MKSKYKPLILCTIGILHFGFIREALASDYSRGNGFTSHHLVAGEPYARKASQLPGNQKLELREYLNYETREPCQGYQTPPQPFIQSHCSLSLESEPVAVTETTVETKKVETVSRELRPVIVDYKIYFDHDRYNIRDSEQVTLNKVANEIKKYDPYEVTIAGYADRSGPDDYNIVLSQKRALAVSTALTGIGIPNRILEEEAFGEANPAVPTADGVRLEQNRRVEVQFRK